MVLRSYLDSSPRCRTLYRFQWDSAFVEIYLVFGFKYLVFSPLLGEMIQFDEHIFQMGGSTTN